MNPPPPLPPRWDLRLPAGGAQLPAVGDDHATNVRTNCPEFSSQRCPDVGEGSAQAPQPRNWRTWCCGRKSCTATEQALEEGEMQHTAPVSSQAKEEGEVTMGGLLPDSIYVWACGEKSSDQEEDLTTSDELIGCLMLLFQAMSYIVVIWRSGDAPDDSEYSVVSITAALYLLVQTASPDLRAGFSLLFDGASARYRIFGAATLVVFGLLVTAAMKVIFSSAENDGAVVANAVTVLFIADLDEKARTFFVTVPQKWRLFWLVNIISVSFSLAIAGIVFVGDESAIIAESGYSAVLSTYPTYVVFVVNPAAMTFISFTTSGVLRAMCNIRTNGRPWKTLRNGVCAAVKAVRLEPFFYAALGVWLVVSLAAWFCTGVFDDLPSAVAVSSGRDRDDSHGPEFTTNPIELIAANVALAAGLMMMALRLARDRARLPTTIPGPRHPTSRHSAEDHSDGSTRRQQPTRVPALLVGWGLGYWLVSLLYLLGHTWPKGWWPGAPLVLEIVGYILLPLTFLLGVFVVADSNVYGTGVERVLQPVADALADNTRVLHWAMVTVLRDVTIIWVFYVIVATRYLNIL